MDANAFTASFCPTISDRVPGFTTFMTVFVKLILSKASSFSILCRLCAVSISSSSSSKSSRFTSSTYSLCFSSRRSEIFLSRRSSTARRARSSAKRSSSRSRIAGISPSCGSSVYSLLSKTSRSIPKRRFFRFS